MSNDTGVAAPETNGQVSQLTVEQALANISQVCAAFSGNLQQHQLLQESLRVLGEALPS